jgi:protein-histidine pros-kinase
VARLKPFLHKLLPDSLFGRLALLLMVAVVSSHVLALTLMFEVLPRPPLPPPDFAGGLPLGPPHGALPGPHPGGPPPLLHLGLLLDIAVRLSALTLAAWVGAKWLSEPMRRLAEAARELGRDIHRAPLKEEGTRECIATTRVFNQMQIQMRQQLEQRDQFVAAVSHDLRTPLTRLALRAESLQDPQERARFGKDIVEMDAMIRATLDYLRGAADPEPFVPLDVGSLLTSMAFDCQDCGQDVQVVGMVAAAPVRAQASSLRRCIGNLVENAVRYGLRARITLTDSDGSLQIAVSDDGPGIAEAELQKVMAPFYRLEGSRNRNSGGVGLGLATASDIAQRHAGTLQLGNGPAGGLVATLTLPRHEVIMPISQTT